MTQLIVPVGLDPLARNFFKSNKSTPSGLDLENRMEGEGQGSINLTPNDDDKTDRGTNSWDLFHSIRPLLITGGLIGVLPISGVFSYNSKNYIFRWRSVFTFNALLTMTISTISVVWESLVTFWSSDSDVNGIDKIWNMMGINFFRNLSVVYVQFWRKRSALIYLIRNWNKKLGKMSYDSFDKKLRVHCKLILIIILGHGVIENFLHDIVLSRTVPDETGKSIMEKYFYSKMNHFSKLYSYNPSLVVFYFICNKLSTYAWNFVDIFIMIMCRALAGQYKIIHKTAGQRLRGQGQGAAEIEQGPQNGLEEEAKLVSKDLLALANITEEFSGFLSPFLVPSYTTHLIFIAMHVYRWLVGYNYDVHDPYAALYVTMSSLQFISRTTLMTFYAGEVHRQSQKLSITVRKICLETSSPGLDRLERFVSGNPVGMDIFGVVIITHRLFLSVISFVFSLVIVLLQVGPR